jgi:RNA polymerase sigma factor (sigma-70 family)
VIGMTSRVLREVLNFRAGFFARRPLILSAEGENDHMPGFRLAVLVRRLRRDATPDAGECADAVLVARFADTRDEVAFELLVRRHGAMVLAACQRVLGHTEDAEDAFQAAFLVLARKAASVRRGTAVPAWLHRVAVRIARRAAGRRRPTTTLVADPPARPAPDEAERSELRALLDVEIDRLSEPFRRAFVLCYLEGLSNADAAQVLGCPVGTVESRLTAARRALRDRLARRIELPVGVLALLAGAPELSADTVATLTRAGVTAARQGLRPVIGIVREPAAQLAEGGIRAMTKTTRVWAAAVLGVALIGLAAGVVWANRPAEPPAQPAVAAELPAVAPLAKTAREPEAKGEAWPLAKELEAWGVGNLIGVAPDEKSVLTLQNQSISRIWLVYKAVSTLASSENFILAAAISPDGKYIATAEGANGVKLRDAKGKIVEALWPKCELPAAAVAFTPDGTKLVVYCEHTTEERGSRNGNFKGNFPGILTTTKKTCVSVWDLSTRKELGHPIRTDTAEGSYPPKYTLAGHGRFLLRTLPVYDEARSTPGHPFESTRFSLMNTVSGKEAKPITVDGASSGLLHSDPLSPDGKTLVLVNATGNELRFLDPETGKDRFPVAVFRRPIWAVAFSPDGRFVAAGTGRVSNESVAAPSEVVIWDAATGKELARLTDKETIRDYTVLAFSPDGSFLAAQSNRSITIWGHLPAPESAPEPVKPVGKAPEAKAPGIGAAPARFQALIRDLAGDGVTDARRVEALFLATLGRFPTDVEARTLAAQLARREDKAAALRDLLGTLTETNEFRTHVEELGRLAK